jgi:hypothetical protein
MSASASTSLQLFELALAKEQWEMATVLDKELVPKDAAVVVAYVRREDVDDSAKARGVSWLVNHGWPLNASVLMACVEHITEYRNLQILEMPETLSTVLEAMIARGLPVTALQDIYCTSTGASILEYLKPFAANIFDSAL